MWNRSLQSVQEIGRRAPQNIEYGLSGAGVSLVYLDSTHQIDQIDQWSKTDQALAARRETETGHFFFRRFWSRTVNRALPILDNEIAAGWIKGSLVP